jgi:hypothetical protein
MAWVTNVYAKMMQMWCKCFAMMMTNFASSALSFMYYKMQYTKKVIILFDFLLGLCVVLNFFSISMYFGPQGCLKVGEHCALSLLQIVKLVCFEEVASYIHLFVGKLQKF